MKARLSELEARRAAFCQKMDVAHPNWESALILSKVNQYYFTGTIQNALLLIKKGGGYSYNVRQSIQRAEAESPLDNLFAMKSYGDVAGREGADLGHAYLELDYLPYSTVMRLQKNFQMKSINSLDTTLRNLRAVKSAYELSVLERCGKMHERLFSEFIPDVLQEGLSEAHFYGQVQERMMLAGHQGITRFYDYQTEFHIGQVGFGENMLYPNNFSGGSGGLGTGPAAPLAGNPSRHLKKGDLVLADIGFGLDGYHTDKTQVFCFGAAPSPLAVRFHQECLDIAARAVEALRPGAIPSKIYADAINSLSPEGAKIFMSYADSRASFIGHGVGLNLDELPAIAKGVDEPLRENMTIAIEPKMGVPGLGVVGTEDTYVVTPNGGRCLTGGAKEIIVVEA